MDTLATRFVAVATTEEVAAGHYQTRKASNVFVQDFWVPHGCDVAMDSLRVVQAQKKKGKAPADDQEAGERRATTGDMV